MRADEKQELDESMFVREQLRGGGESPGRRNARLVTGNPSYLQLFKYEIITTFFGGFPGALGLFLRKHLYPLLFRSIGQERRFWQRGHD